MTLSENNLCARVQAMLADTFGRSPEEIPADLAFGDIPEWDSLGHMEVIMRLEEQFGAEVSTDTIAELTDIPAICAYLNRKE